MPSPAGPKGLSEFASPLNLKRYPVEEPTVHELEGRQTTFNVRQGVAILVGVEAGGH
jgi:hypothetical protein